MTNNNPNPQQFQPQPVPQQQPAQQPPFAQQPHFQQPQQPAPQQPMTQQPYRQPAEEKHMSALGITAFVLGVIALVLSWIPIVNNVAFAFAIAGIIFGCFALYATREERKEKGPRTSHRGSHHLPHQRRSGPLHAIRIRCRRGQREQEHG